MQILFVRHGRPEHAHTPGGIADPGLCPIGTWQAERLTSWLKLEPIDAIVTSPKRRAKHTVAALAAELGITTTVIDDLDEVDRRAEIYMPTELLPTEGGEYWEAVLRQEWDAIGWDSPDVFSARVAAAVAGIVADPPGEHVVVACHGGVIQYGLASLLGAPGVRFQTDYASISRVGIGQGSKAALISLNETGHFDATRDSITGTLRDGMHPTRRF